MGAHSERVRSACVGAWRRKQAYVVHVKLQKLDVPAAWQLQHALGALLSIRANPAPTQKQCTGHSVKADRSH